MPEMFFLAIRIERCKIFFLKEAVTRERTLKEFWDD